MFKEIQAMTDIIPRSHIRTTHKAPIQYALLNSAQFEPTRTYDYSANGLCYEVTRELAPETEVCILMDNYAPDHSGPEAYRSYVALVRWVHLLSKNGTNRYAVGAQIVARSHDILTSEEQLPQYQCDLCGKTEPKHRIQTAGAGVDLCRRCLKHFSHIPSTKIRQCVERFLLGNVI
jgi:ribosomal protein L37AE/L43A